MITCKQVAWVVTAAMLGCGDDTSDAFDQDSASSETSATSTTGTSSTTASTSSASADETTGTSSSSTAADSTGEPIFDVGMGDTDVADGCGCEYEYIWIA